MQDGILANALLSRLLGEADGLPAAQAIADAIIEKAASGDVRAFEIIRNTIGEKPKEKPSDSIIRTEIKWTGQ